MSDPVTIALIVAVSQNGVIGAGGDLLWKISDDLKWFKKITMGKPIIMGRKTFESIGKALPGRDNIVVTRRPGFDPGGVFVTHSIEAAIKLGNICAQKNDVQEICVIGGGEIYAQTIAHADRLYVTSVKASVQGDVFFPKVNSRIWDAELVGSCEKGPKNQYSCEFFTYRRR